MSSQGSDGGPGGGEDEASFYRDALVREALRAASDEGSGRPGDVTGDLRRRVREQLYRRPDDVRLLLRAADALSRAAATEHRINPLDQERLLEDVARLMDDVGRDLLSPPGSSPESEQG